MIAMINRVVSTINRIAGAIAALLLFYVLVHIIYEIILRTLFSTSTFVLDEFVGYAVAAMTFLSLGYALETGSLIRVDLAITRLKGRLRRWVELFCISSSFGMAGF